MCGRCASSRDIQGVRHACAYRPRSGRNGGKKAVKPTLHQCSSQTYYPSYNICPQSNTPVLISGHHPHISENRKSLAHTQSESVSSLGPEDQVLQVMQWGLVPGWHRGDSPSSFGTVLNNCRCETLLEKPSFRSAVEKRQRCVVVADGFFEWYREKGQRQPYFIYFADRSPTEEMGEVGASCEGGAGGGCEGAAVGGGDEGGAGGGREGGAVGGECEEVKSEWEHPNGRMLTMAGLFDIWRSSPGEAPLYTYTVITVEANPTFAKIHHRMPAVLDGQEAVGAWLDPTHSTRDLSHLLHPVECLSWHTVSPSVNNSRYHAPECVLPYDTSKQSSGGQKTTLMKWFTPQVKKPRLHPPQ